MSAFQRAFFLPDVPSVRWLTWRAAYCSVICSLIVATPQLVLGQAPGGEERQRSRTAIEEIVVTATKRTMALQDVPASVTAFAGEQLEGREIEAIHDLNFRVPNLHMGTVNGVQAVAIRGIGIAQIQAVGDPGVAQHVDGVYQPRTASLLGVYEDLESLEVLRGPQGTLYGRNATGGTINLVTRKPSDEFTGSASILRGSYERWRAKAAISGPISERLSYRISAIYDDRDKGYTKNYVNGVDDLEDEQIFATRGSLRFLPTDTLTVDLSGHYEVRHSNYAGGATLTPPSDILWPVYSAAPFTTEPHRQFSDNGGDDDREDTSLTLTVTWDPSEQVTIKSITGFLHNELEQFADGDGVGLFAVDQRTGYDSTTLSQEISASISLFDDRVELLIGGFHFHDSLDWYNFLPLNFITWPLPPGTEIAPGVTVPFVIRSAFDQETNSWAVFGDAKLHVTDRFRIFGGVRGSWEDKEAVVKAFQVTPICGFGLPDSHLDKRWSDLSPRIGAELDVSDDVMVYAQWQQGFKAGGFSSSTCSDEFDQEEVDSYEIGLKATLLDERVSLNTSAFYYDYTDLQLQQVVGLQTEVDNASESEVYGVEAELVVVPADGLRLDLAWSFLDAEYDDFSDCDPLLFPGNCSAPVLEAGLAVFEDVSGNPLTQAPRYTLRGGIEYSFSFLQAGEMTVRGDAFWSDEVYFRQFKRRDDRQDDYKIVNLYAAFVPSDQSRLTLRAFVKNLTDERYILSNIGLGSTSLNHFGIWGPPRTFGFEISWEF